MTGWGRADIHLSSSVGLLALAFCTTPHPCSTPSAHSCITDTADVFAVKLNVDAHIIHIILCVCVCPTCVVEEGGDEGAVLEEGVAGGDVLKVTLLKQRVLKHHRPHFQVHKSASNHTRGRWNQEMEAKRDEQNMEVESGGRQKEDAKRETSLSSRV